MHDDLCFQSVDELSRSIARGDLSPVELTRAYLVRMEALEPKLNAIITPLPDIAIQQAQEAEAEIRTSGVRGPLHGIPYGVKDLFDTKGIPTTWGSTIFADRVPDRDAAVIERLHSAGGILAAKLAMSEFAGGLTRSHLLDYPHNPWKLDRTTEGSSTGSAAATSAAMTGYAIGTETGGSIIYPSAACGLSGLRPTYGRVSRFGCMPLSWSLDKVGPMARSAVDCGLILDAIAGHDPRDRNSSKMPFRFSREPSDLRGQKVAIVREEFGRAPAHNGRQFEAALGLLQELGLVLEDVSLPARPYREVYKTIDYSEAGTFFKPLYDDKRIEKMYTASRRANFLADSMLPASDYLKAQRIRAMITQESDELLTRYRILIAPTRPKGAGLFEPKSASKDPEAQPGMGKDNTMWMANLAGLPGISIPCGFDPDGMPLGLHLVGAAWDEQGILDVAMAFQGATDFHLGRPTLRT
jgi:aspartyl-tRNA(Asn)/glutamyl-tRNA(Gln) amidotransferase subunit A